MVAKTIRELLGRRPVISISPEATLEAACDLMAAENVGVLPVIEGHALCGLIIERDVIRHVSQCGGFETAKVADAMTRNVVCIETRDCIVEAVARMREDDARFFGRVALTLRLHERG